MNYKKLDALNNLLIVLFKEMAYLQEELGKAKTREINYIEQKEGGKSCFLEIKNKIYVLKNEIEDIRTMRETEETKVLDNKD